MLADIVQRRTKLFLCVSVLWSQGKHPEVSQPGLGGGWESCGANPSHPSSASLTLQPSIHLKTLEHGHLYINPWMLCFLAILWQELADVLFYLFLLFGCCAYLSHYYLLLLYGRWHIEVTVGLFICFFYLLVSLSPLCLEAVHSISIFEINTLEVLLCILNKV